MVDEKILDRIRKLLAKARGNENENEAMIFGQRAAEMLEQYNLQESEVHKKDFDNEPVIEITEVNVDFNAWRQAIFSGAARLYFCKIYTSHSILNGKLRPAIVVCGKRHNAEIAVDMAWYLIKTTQRLAKAYSTYRRDVLQFEKGCGMRIGQRLKEMAAHHASQEHAQITGNSNLPALYQSEVKLVDTYMDGLGLGKGRKVNLKYLNAAHDGAAAGNKVHLGGQIGTTSSSRALR